MLLGEHLIILRTLKKILTNGHQPINIWSIINVKHLLRQITQHIGLN